MSHTIRRALLSVSNKEGLLEFARALRSRGVTILSTGGTAALLREDGIEVTDVASVTGFPEIMDGRVKTLHPRIHGRAAASTRRWRTSTSAALPWFAPPPRTTTA